MYALLTPIVASALLSSLANAHGIVTQVTAGGKTYQGYSPDFQYQKSPPAVVGWTAPQTQDHGFVLADNLQSPDIICHKGATNAQAYAEVAAGDSVTLQWSEWPESHHGPMLDYLADCQGDCTTVDKTALKFFKIDEVGMTDTSTNPPLFGDDVMIANGNKWTVKIPASVKPGNYVLRHETIALHEGNQLGKAQMYPQCINLKITGSGTELPAGIPATELYKTSDPGVHFNIYNKPKSYPIPGPPLMAGGATAPATGGTTAPAASAVPSPKSNAATDEEYPVPAVEAAPATDSGTTTPAPVVEAAPATDEEYSSPVPEASAPTAAVPSSTSGGATAPPAPSGSSAAGPMKGKGGRHSKWGAWRSRINRHRQQRQQRKQSRQQRKHPRQF